ncbi:MAG: hypothetical protein GYA02_04280 [Clostridiaceae bacterium]|nr:hypothetical protein [Clostridiaceae bacterium]
MKNKKRMNKIKDLCNKVKINFKKHVLIILLIASAYCVIRYSELPILPFVPDVVANLLIKPNPDTTLYEVFRLLENLSLAYIASYVFYLIIDYFPNKNRASQALELAKGEINFIHFNMGDLIMRINAVANIPKDINEITISDLHKLDDFTFSNETLYLYKYSVVNGEKKITTRYTENFYTYSTNNIHNIVNCLKTIKTISCSIYIDFDILQILSSIETNWFLNWILKLKPNQKEVRMGFSNDYYQFIQSYKKLNKLEFIKDMDKTEVMDDKQKMEFEQMWNNNTASLD